MTFDIWNNRILFILAAATILKWGRAKMVDPAHAINDTRQPVSPGSYGLLVGFIRL